MIRLVFSNKTECLLRELAGDLRQRRGGGAHPLEPVELVVPNRNMETWVRLGLAQLTGISANLRFSWLNRFIGELVLKACPGEMKLVDLDIAEAAILAALLDDQLLQTEELRPVNSYLQSTVGNKGEEELSAHGLDAHLITDGIDLRRVQLAARLAFLFQEYSFSRPEMIAAWRGEENRFKVLSDESCANPEKFDQSLTTTVNWQRALWRTVFGRDGILEKNPPKTGGRWITMDLLPFENKLFANLRDQNLPPVHIFGISYLARIFQHLLAFLGEIIDLKIYALNPCAMFWEDVKTPRGHYLHLDREYDRREQFSGKAGADEVARDPFGIYEMDNPALLYWGRPGAEHMRLLGELTEYDFTDAFENPLEKGGGLLHRLQLDILNRAPEEELGKSLESPADRPQKADDTIKLVAAPSVRREVEWVADEIWRLVASDKGPLGGEPLRFSDVAIIVNSAEQDRYLPMIEAVFAAAHDLPASITDLPGSAGSRMIEAMTLLLELPFGCFSRSEMLAFMGHPAVIKGFDEGAGTAEDLALLAERLGIIFGADHRDHRDTYIDEDIYNWDQGIRRLALGAFMTGEKSGDQRIFKIGDRKWLVEEALGPAATTAARFGLLARSLLADARYVREKWMTLSNWAKFYCSQIGAYLHGEEEDRRLLRRILGKLELMDLGYRVSGRIAAEIAGRALDSLTGSRGQYLAEGVAVSTFVPMRAIPFRVIFLLGLGEGLFPASAQRDALDLRSARRRQGDVDPSERDRYMFLETLLCTRERIYLSYVNRDEHTGDTLQPSAVVQELLHILELGYLGPRGIGLLTVEPPLPLRRYDEEFTRQDTFFDEARVEARIREISRQWHGYRGREERGRPVEGFDSITSTGNREGQAVLLKMLGLPGEPPPAASLTAATRFGDDESESTLETPASLSLSVLRRFLECPMQGWASALLGLTEVDEDLTDRQEEDFEINRLVETTLLNDVFYKAAAVKGAPVETFYEEQSLRALLAGQVPAGALGRAIKERHLLIIRGWLSFLEKLEIKGKSALDSDGAGCLHRARFGRSHRPESGGEVFDPLVLEIPLAEPDNQKRIIPVRISGLTEGLSENRLLALSPQSKKPPLKDSKNIWAGNFRYILRGAITLAALTAVGAAGSGEQQILILFADGKNDPGALRVSLKPLSPEQARSWLAALAADLLTGPHAYLLPCNAVFEEYWERGAKSPVNGTSLSLMIKRMAANERSYFPSLWGPVPSPRLYEPPPAAAVKEMVERRFEPLFQRIISREVLS